MILGRRLSSSFFHTVIIVIVVYINTSLGSIYITEFMRERMEGQQATPALELVSLAACISPLTLPYYLPVYNTRTDFGYRTSQFGYKAESTPAVDVFVDQHILVYTWYMYTTSYNSTAVVCGLWCMERASYSIPMCTAGVPSVFSKLHQKWGHTAATANSHCSVLAYTKHLRCLSLIHI